MDEYIVRLSFTMSLNDPRLPEMRDLLFEQTRRGAIASYDETLGPGYWRDLPTGEKVYEDSVLVWVEITLVAGQDYAGLMEVITALAGGEQ